MNESDRIKNNNNSRVFFFFCCYSVLFCEQLVISTETRICPTTANTRRDGTGQDRTGQNFNFLGRVSRPKLDKNFKEKSRINLMVVNAPTLTATQGWWFVGFYYIIRRRFHLSFAWFDKRYFLFQILLPWTTTFVSRDVIFQNQFIFLVYTVVNQRHQLKDTKESNLQGEYITTLIYRIGGKNRNNCMNSYISD